MAIRPTDIQGAIWQSAQNAPLAQRAEDGPRVAQAAAQAAFAAQAEVRNETVASTSKGEGNRVDANAERQRERQDAEQRRKPRNAFEDEVDEASGLDEPPHLIDFIA